MVTPFVLHQAVVLGGPDGQWHGILPGPEGCLAPPQERVVHLWIMIPGMYIQKNASGKKQKQQAKWPPRGFAVLEKLPGALSVSVLNPTHMSG